MAVSPGEMLQLGSSGLVLALAGVLVWLDPRGRVNRVFALLLALRGLAGGTYALGLATGSDAWWQLTPLFAIPLVVVPLYFALVFPTLRPWLQRHPHGWTLFAGVAAVLELAYVVDPSLYWDLSAYDGAVGGPALGAPAGALFAVELLLVTGYGALALLFVRDTVRLREGPSARSTFLVGLAFSLTATYVSVLLTTSSQSVYILRHGPVLSSVLLAAIVFALVLVALAGARLARHAADSTEARRRWRHFLGWTGVATASALVPATTDGGAALTVTLAQSTAALWRLALPLLVVYALLRYQLFGIELRVKRTVYQGALVGLIAFGFLTLSEALERVVPLGGAVPEVAAAVTIALALHPIQRVAEGFVEALMPTVRDTADYRENRRLELYRASLESAALDGVITEREHAVLERLRRELGVGEDEAQRLQEEVLSMLGSRAGASVA